MAAGFVWIGRDMHAQGRHLDQTSPKIQVITMLNTRVIKPTDEAHATPLLIKNILLSGQRYERTQEIVYRDISRYDYATFNQRICRLANALTAAGVKAGDTVAVMDWDSNRYLECMFAIPMIGAVLHTINIRLSPDQILYTMNHAEDIFVLVNSEFVPIYKADRSPTDHGNEAPSAHRWAREDGGATGPGG